MTVPHGLAEIRATFGTVPVGHSLAVQQWAAEHLAMVALPYPLRNAYVPALDRTIRRLYCHRKIGSILQAAFAMIQAKGLETEALEYGGCWNVRPIRGRPDRLSTHAWGIAIDLNPRSNALGTPGRMHPEVVEILETLGFRWGGRFTRKDPMHFQFCTGY